MFTPFSLALNPFGGYFYKESPPKVCFSRKFELVVEDADCNKFFSKRRDFTENVRGYLIDIFVNHTTLELSSINNLKIDEVIGNSFDAFVKKTDNLRLKDKFVVEAIISHKDGQFTLEIRDNGTGFLNRNKGEEFTYNQETDVIKKDSSTSCGGVGVGIQHLIMLGKKFEIAEKDFGWKVRFKNGEKEGVSVFITFNNKAKLRRKYPLKAICAGMVLTMFAIYLKVKANSDTFSFQ